MMSVRCGHCDAELPDENPSEPRTPCPECGSMSRRFSAEVCDGVGVSDQTKALRSTCGRTVEFRESERDGRTTAAQSNNDGLLETQITGDSPEGEDDTLCVCRLLIERLNQDGGTWGVPSPGVDDVDCEAENQGTPAEHLLIQVVRAVVDPAVWRDLNRQGSVRLEMSAALAAEQLLEADRDAAIEQWRLQLERAQCFSVLKPPTKIFLRNCVQALASM